MYHRFGHAKEHFVKLGDKVKKGQKILSVGTGNGQWSAHTHYDCPINKLSSWTSYVFGMTIDQVRALYANPTNNIKVVMPEYDHMGFGYLEHANYGTAGAPKWCFHPGVDLNGAGAGNADLGDPVYSPCDGVVVYNFDDGQAKNGGWGKLLVIQETEQKPNVPAVVETPKQDEVVPIPVKIETPPEVITATAPPTYEELTDPKNQLKKLISSLWNLIKLIFKK